MVSKQAVIDGTIEFINTKVMPLLGNSNLVIMAKPFINRAIENKIGKLDSILNLVANDKGMIDIEGIFNETIDNLIVSKVQAYPSTFGTFEIGNSAIKWNIPVIDKALNFNIDDIKELNNIIISKNK